MIQSRAHFGIGLFVGIIVTALFFQFFAPRYDIIESDNKLIKQDKWSGESWKYQGNKWEKITEMTRDWEPIDDALTKALNISVDNNTDNSNARMVSLRKKYSVLEDISDEDIMERIKYVYARKIMVDLYFDKIK
jgi:hypothetical protein